MRDVGRKSQTPTHEAREAQLSYSMENWAGEGGGLVGEPDGLVSVESCWSGVESRVESKISGSSRHPRGGH